VYKLKNNLKAMESIVISCSNQRKVVWFVANDNTLYVCISDKEQRFVYKENVIIQTENRVDFQLDDNVVNPTQLVRDMVKTYSIYLVKEKDVRSVSLNPEYSIVSGKLCLSSKTQWGITSKGLRKYSFIPMFSNGNYPMYIVASKLKPSNVDMYVRVEINRWDENKRHPQGNLIETIGPVSNFENYSNVIVSSHQVIPRHKKQIHRKVEQHIITEPSYIIDEDWTDTELTMSIDPSGCKDIDDVLASRCFENEIEFAVHIATPTIWFSEDSPLDKLSKVQSTSVYIDDKTLHMLPELLSTNYASLLENEERYCLSVVWTTGDKKPRIVRTKIKNRIATSYEDAECMNEYGLLIKNMKSIWGNDVPEDSHSLVEFAMIKANSVVAEFLVEKCGENTLLRKTIGNSAYYLPYSNTDENKHISLSLNLYTHFTSPIRRYADQLVHRQILKLLCENYREIKNEMNIVDYIHMNHVNKQTKHIESQHRWLNVIDKTTKVSDINGKILSIEDDFAYIKIDDYTAYIRIIPYELKDLIYISKIDDNLVIKCKDSETTYEKCENFHVRMYWIDTNGLEGLKFEWLFPSISKFIKCCL
tara:strand:- start:12648 stop:14414 length:1767 start_codon:yes stop_codon:yes gene_type:complete